MPRKVQALPTYKRAGGWYADLRRHSDVGGKRIAVTLEGERTPVGSRKVAVEVCKQWIKEYEKTCSDRRLIDGPMFGKSIERFLEWKAENTSVTERTLEED